ncbi:MAG: undecaprenyl-diphosphate phosphatase [Lachnospiraceae bacterium]|nr:undecaprenyl-diphosphate phosphatase [Lachnospiraceae bacterium]MDN4743726.1 undecaprenyl-diphosphate phosphatase [Lachnospiraceae bacterium C1.1]
MSILQAVLLGILQGLAEFLPISSSGHLAIFQNLFHIGEGTEDMFLFDILLHLGTLISIFVAFHKDIWKLITETLGMLNDLFMNLVSKIKGGETVRVVRTGYRKFVLMVIISTIPTGIIGILLKDITEAASKTLIMPGIFLLMTSVLLFIADKAPDGEKNPKTATYLDSVILGVAQGLATLPGISRSGTTITTALLCGFEKKYAVKYSFIMSIPAVLGACVLEISDAKGTAIEPSYIVGLIVSAVVGYAAIKTMLVIVRKKKYIIFSIYCLIAGLVAIIGSFIVK